MEGVRLLAKALEEGKTSRGANYVYVHSEGRIDALGTLVKQAQVGTDSNTTSTTYMSHVAPHQESCCIKFG